MTFEDEASTMIYLTEKELACDDPEEITHAEYSRFWSEDEAYW